MNTTSNVSKGCGGGTCGCGSQVASPDPVTIASINGIALHGPNARPDEESLREQAFTELLRQQAR